jgi:hypothetical protein
MAFVSGLAIFMVFVDPPGEVYLLSTGAVLSGCALVARAAALAKATSSRVMLAIVGASAFGGLLATGVLAMVLFSMVSSMGLVIAWLFVAAGSVGLVLSRRMAQQR